MAGLWMVVCAVLAIAVSDQTAGLIKHLVHRLRPCAIGEARLLLAECSHSFSFPSNHAANHFTLAVFLSLLFRQRWLTFVLLFWAAFIAFSQVYVGLHYPLDIAAGAVLGALVGGLVFLIYRNVVARIS